MWELLGSFSQTPILLLRKKGRRKQKTEGGREHRGQAIRELTPTSITWAH